MLPGKVLCMNRIDSVQCTPLKLRVTADLELDLGYAEHHESGVDLIPPKRTQFEQLIDFLDRQPDPGRRSRSGIMCEAYALSALCLRWGTYLGALLDPEKSVWEHAGNRTVCAIHNSEMARINIEASAALEYWVELYRSDAGVHRVTELSHKAAHYLKLPRKVDKPTTWPFELSDPAVSAELFARTGTAAESARHLAAQTPSRLFANYMIALWYRQGPIENVHAGRSRDFPLDRRRITATEERTIIAFATGLFRYVAATLSRLRSQRLEWAEAMMPYGLLSTGGIYNWSLTERTRQVRLPA